MMFPFSFMVLLGCAHLLLSKSLTLAFVDTAKLNEAIRHFLDIFEMYGGREFVRRIEQGEPIDEQDFQELDDAFGIDCLLKTIRLNVFPRKPIYKPVSACLTDEPGFPDCKQDQIQFVDNLDASGTEFRYLSYASGQSENILGVFWIDYRGFSGSSILTFAESKDGGKLSTGKLEKDEENISYRHRTAGDRSWAFSGKNGDFFTAPINDLIYESRVIEGSDANPTKLQIFPSFSLFFAPFVRFHFRECFDWLIYFDMVLITDDDDKGDRENSVIWRRNSAFFGVSTIPYPLTQIIDGDGTRIEPAYSQWLEDQKIRGDANMNAWYSIP